MIAHLKSLLRPIFRHDGSLRHVEQANDRGFVARRYPSLWKLLQNLLAHDSKRLSGKLPVIDRDRLNVVEEDAGEGVGATGRVLVTTSLVWHRWSGSCWDIDDSGPLNRVNAPGEVRS